MSRRTVVLEDGIVDDKVSEAGQVPPWLPAEPGDRGEPPFEEPNRQPVIDAARLGMLVFLAAETMLFAGFVAAYLVFRFAAPVWPPPFQPRLPLGTTGLNTLVLLASALTMRQAVRAGRGADRRGFVTALGATAALGGAFLALQGSEWTRLLAFGLTAASGVYGGMFYVVIGAHGAHLLGALAWLAGLAARGATARLAEPVVAHAAVFALYWYFVVGLWPVLYVLVYLV